MEFEEELAAMQQEALDELEGNNDDTDTDDSEQEESTRNTDNEREDDNDGEDSEGYEDENVQEDDESLDYEDSETEYDDEADDSDSDNEENSNDFEPIEVTIGNQKISLNSQEELIQFVKNGKQNQSSGRKRKSENDQIIEQGNLSKEDLALLIDAKQGNKQAIAKLAKESGVDIYDIDTEEADGYQPQFQARIATEIDEVAEDIVNNETLHQSFKQVISTVPADFAQHVAGDASTLRNFAGHVESGLAQKIIPEAIKAQMLNGGTFFDNYSKIGREMSESKEAPEKSKTKRKENPRADKLRKRAATPRSKNKGTKMKETGDDIWNMSSADFNKKYM